MSDVIKIGWVCTSSEGSICFPEPRRVHLPKDQAPDGRGFLTCPSVRTFVHNTYSVVSPFSLHLRCEVLNGREVVRPVFPFTSLTEQKVQEFVRIEPRSSWRSPNVAVVQIVSPYLFVADEPVILNQAAAILTTPTSYFWRTIPGRINIYDWQRPLNFAFEWYLHEGDFVVKSGEPIYHISFEAVSAESIRKISLVRCRMTPELDQRIRDLRGVTSLKRGITPLFEVARELRKGQNFIRE